MVDLKEGAGLVERRGLHVSHQAPPLLSDQLPAGGHTAGSAVPAAPTKERSAGATGLWRENTAPLSLNRAHHHAHAQEDTRALPSTAGGGR